MGQDRLTNRNDKYLDVFDSSGNWRHHADYFVIAAVSEIDSFAVKSLHAAMVNEDESNPPSLLSPLSPSAQRRASKLIAKREFLHILVGEVVLEMARISFTMDVIPSLGAARRLVAFNHRAFQGKPMDSRVEKLVEREVEKGFRKYRDVSHIRAAIIYTLVRDGELASGENSFRELLGIARTFEQVVDKIAAKNQFSWSPLRIPREILCVNHVPFPKLSDQEIAAAKLG